MKPATVLIADDHSIVIEGLRRVLEPAFTVVGAVADGRALVVANSQLKPDVVIADVSMPLLNGIKAARQIRRNHPHVKIVFLTMHCDLVYASEAFHAGGSAYVLKSSAAAEILIAIREALAGCTYISAALNDAALHSRFRRRRDPNSNTVQLSFRQREVVCMAARGHSTKEIAGALSISPRTVEYHRYHAMRSLGLHTVAEIVQYAIKHGLVRL